MDTERLRRDYFLPGAIVLAGFIVAVAVYAIRSDHSPVLTGGNPDAVNPVTPDDRKPRGTR